MATLPKCSAHELFIYGVRKDKITEASLLAKAQTLAHSQNSSSLSRSYDYYLPLLYGPLLLSRKGSSLNL